jgi:hypothetical protein
MVPSNVPGRHFPGPHIMKTEDNSEEKAVGWDAVDQATTKIYGDQEPQHYAPDVYYSQGGEQPLDGISIYNDEKNKCYHYVTYGFSELYEKESDDTDISGYGFELTFRLKYEKVSPTYPVWPVNLLQNIAKVTFSRGMVFDEFQTLSSGPIRVDPPTHITGILFVPDKSLGELKTENGAFKFLQIFGLTTAEYNQIVEKTLDRREMMSGLQKTNPLSITDVERK